MGPSRISRAGLVAVLVFALVGAPARALVNIDDGRNQIFVSDTLNIGYDSNIFARAAGGGDFFYGLNLGTEFVRHAGLIALDATLSVNATRYGRLRGENFQDPSLQAVLSKQTGRTTGSLTLGAARESRADTAANLRDQSWLYTANLAVNYPVIERYSFSGGLGYSQRNFADNTSLVNSKTYTANLDFNYIFSNSRNLVAGYQLRRETTSTATTNTDHSFTVGVSGNIIAGINGQVRAGIEERVPEGTADGTFHAWTGSAALTWIMNRRLNFTGQLGKDFSSTSTNISVDTLSASLGSQYLINARNSFIASTGWSSSRFLGVLGADRNDHSWTWSLALNHTYNDHLKFALSYVFFEDWSTLQLSNFARRTVTLSATSQF